MVQKKKINRNILLFGLMIFLSSCIVGKKYSRPEISMHESSLVSSDSLSLSDLEWWNFYIDENLQTLLNRVIENNKDMAIASARMEELMAQKRINTAALLPKIEANAYGDQEKEKYRGEKSTESIEFRARLIMNWEIDLWGNLRWGRKKAIAEYLESVETRRALQMTLVSEVARSYFELMALDNELSIVRQTFSTREEGVRQAKLRFEGGLTSETSYRQAEVELASTATLIPDLEKQIRQKENEIAILCGDFPQEIPRNRIDNLEEIPPHLLIGMSSELLLRRPDVLAAEQSLIAANAAVGMSFTDRFPRISLTGSYGMESDELKSLLKSPYSLIAGTLVAPLFEFGSRKAKYKAQQAVYKQEVANYEKTVLTVFKEASDAIAGFNAARQTRQKREDLEQASKKYIELARLQYLNGVINYLDVLDAQRNYFSAQINLSNAVRNEYIALVDLYKALGGGWEEGVTSKNMIP